MATFTQEAIKDDASKMTARRLIALPLLVKEQAKKTPSYSVIPTNVMCFKSANITLVA